MTNSKAHYPQIHLTEKEFRAGVEYTVAQSGFRAALIEKDYFCSLILKYLMNVAECDLVFKGGTLLTKVHTGYFRLSEDLDFSIPISPAASRSDRSKKAEALKKAFARIPEVFSELSIERELKGSNESRQYNGVVLYRSLFSHDNSRILVEVGLREELLQDAQSGEAATLLKNPLTGRDAVPKFTIKSLSAKEAYSEKFRAAMCRTEPAIRDFFDIQVALEKGLVELSDPDFQQMVYAKITVPVQRTINLAEDRILALQKQKESHLEPMLKSEDYRNFNLEKVVEQLRTFARSLVSLRPATSSEE